MKKIEVLVIDKNHPNFNNILTIKEENDFNIICEEDVELTRTQFKLMNELEKIIPKGCYCYEIGRTCPFWESISEDIGKCSLLNISDEEETITLFDHVKECSVNYEF